jgi:adenosylcobinamide amidohydrolase
MKPTPALENKLRELSKADPAMGTTYKVGVFNLKVDHSYRADKPPRNCQEIEVAVSAAKGQTIVDNHDEARAWADLGRRLYIR